MNSQQQKQLKAKEALDFIQSHPAVSPSDISDSCIGAGVHFYIYECDTNHVCRYYGSEGVRTYYSEENYIKYKELFDKEFEEDKESPREFATIDVPYETIYGKKWEFDHIEYWWELSFFVYTGDTYLKGVEKYDRKLWSAYGGPQGGSLTFEDMLIDMADKIKEVYGDFDSYQAFYTDAEKNNHEKVEWMISSPSKDKEGYKEITFNDKHVDISNGLMNVRWLKWFMETEYAKESWKSSFEEWSNLIKKMEETEPETRKQLLNDYKS